MIQPIQVVQNNYGYNLAFTLQDGNGNPLDLTGATLTFKAQSAQDASGTLVINSAAMEIDSATNGTCHYVVQDTDFKNPGTYLGEIVVTTGTSVLSYSGIRIIVLPTLPQTNN